MIKTTKRIIVFLLFVILAVSLITPALSYTSNSGAWSLVPSMGLPDGIVGESYSSGRLRFRHYHADTTWDIQEGQPPPPIWSVALYERGLDQWFSPDYSHSDPWDLPMIEESWYGTLPPGLFLDHLGGLIYGTPTQRGKYTIYAMAFHSDGTQLHVPYHSITIRERLEEPDISIRTVRDSLLLWDAVPEANGYQLYVNGVFARKVGAVTSFNLDDLDLVETGSGHYINLVATSTDDLLLNSYISNAQRYFPGSPGSNVFGSPENPGAYTNRVPQTSVHNVTDSLVMMCISVLATVSLSVCAVFQFRRIKKHKG